MSVVTDMLLLSLEELDSLAVRRLNEWCKKNAAGQTFKQIDTKGAGGCKVFTTNVYACAGNYFPWRELLKALPSFGWDDDFEASLSVLILQPENAERWYAVDATGKPVHQSEIAARAARRAGEPRKDGQIIEISGMGAYWSASYGRWVHASHNATVYYDDAAEPIIEGLREKWPNVRLAPQPDP